MNYYIDENNIQYSNEVKENIDKENGFRIGLSLFIFPIPEFNYNYPKNKANVIIGIVQNLWHKFLLKQASQN